MNYICEHGLKQVPYNSEDEKQNFYHLSRLKTKKLPFCERGRRRLNYYLL